MGRTCSLLLALLLAACTRPAESAASVGPDTSPLDEEDIVLILSRIHDDHEWERRPGPILVDVGGREFTDRFPKALDYFGMALLEVPLGDLYGTGRVLVTSSWEFEEEFVRVEVKRYNAMGPRWTEYLCMRHAGRWWITSGNAGFSICCPDPDAEPEDDIDDPWLW